MSIKLRVHSGQICASGSCCFIGGTSQLSHGNVYWCFGQTSRDRYWPARYPPVRKNAALVPPPSLATTLLRSGIMCRSNLYCFSNAAFCYMHLSMMYRPCWSWEQKHCRRRRRRRRWLIPQTVRRGWNETIISGIGGGSHVGVRPFRRLSLTNKYTIVYVGAPQ